MSDIILKGFKNLVKKFLGYIFKIDQFFFDSKINFMAIIKSWKDEQNK